MSKGCSVQVEAAPRKLVVGQGSLWGIAPRTAKKTINVELEPQEGKTKICYSTKVTSDWKYITLVGSVLAVILACICLWIAVDLGTFMVTGQPSIWSWIINARGTMQIRSGEAFVSLTYGLTVFLLIIVGLEVAVYLHVKSKIDVFVQEVLSQIG